MSQITVSGMMLTDAKPDYQPSPRRIARWRIEAFARAREWAERAGIPYSPFLAVKAL